MNNMPAALHVVLGEAIDELGYVHEPGQVEPVLDAIASALKPLCYLPAELDRMAVPLDRLLAYLTRELGFSRQAAEAASRLLEAASVRGYDWAPPDEVDASDLGLLREGLEAFHLGFIEASDESDNEDENP